MEVAGADCTVAPRHYVILLRRGESAPPRYFQVTAHKAGRRTIFVNAYREDEALAAQTRVQIQVELPVQQPAPMVGPVSIFFSYAHKDERLRDKLAIQLRMLEREGVISMWHDRKITASQEWKGAIDAQLESAHIILLLVSPDFLASDYCWDVEVKRAMQRHEAGEAHVIPVILRPCDWQGAPFGKLQGLPTDTKAVSSWARRDEAFLDVARGIRRLAEKLAAHQ